MGLVHEGPIWPTDYLAIPFRWQAAPHRCDAIAVKISFYTVIRKLIKRESFLLENRGSCHLSETALKKHGSDGGDRIFKHSYKVLCDGRAIKRFIHGWCDVWNT